MRDALKTHPNVTIEFPLELAEIMDGTGNYEVDISAAALELQCDSKRRKLILTLREKKNVPNDKTVERERPEHSSGQG